MVLVPQANFLKVKSMAVTPVKSDHVPKAYVIHQQDGEAASKC